jgi:hypothetical protein
VDQHPISPELAARITAARATVATFRAETDAYIAGTGRKPYFEDWAFRLREDLLMVLAEVDAPEAEVSPGRPQKDQENLPPDGGQFPGGKKATEIMPGAGVAMPGGGWISGPSAPAPRKRGPRGAYRRKDS